jgi:diguanylate cyclase
MGHSSLSYLIDMRIDRLKIDRNFITGIAHNPHNQALVTALLTLGHALDLAILVEGVETREEAERLIELGCDQAQGFLFSKALTPSDASLWLAQRELLGKDIIKLGASKRIA